MERVWERERHWQQDTRRLSGILRAAMCPGGGNGTAS